MMETLKVNKMKCVISDDSQGRCPYCQTDDVSLRYKQHYHKLFKTYGPFDFYVCNACGAGFTHPMPSPKLLQEFYSQYECGMPHLHRAAMEGHNEASWHKMAANDICELANTLLTSSQELSWLDVGAGNGEVALYLNKQLPKFKGYCVDLHACPPLLNSSDVQWHSGDIDSLTELNQYDLVFATGVLEHMVEPAEFIKSCLRRVKPGGVAYFICPNFNSLARVLLGKKWPYYAPGEHLTIPTKAAIKKCIGIISKSFEEIEVVAINSKYIHYAVFYILSVFGLNRLSKLTPKFWGFSLPTGALEIVLRRP